MAIYNLSRAANNNKKRESAFAVYRVDLSQAAYVKGDVLQVGTLPANAVILTSYANVQVAAGAGVTAAVNLRAANTTSLVVASIPLSSVSASTLAGAITPRGVETVVEITLNATATLGAVGVFDVFIEYIDPTSSSSEYTNFV